MRRKNSSKIISVLFLLCILFADVNMAGVAYAAPGEYLHEEPFSDHQLTGLFDSFTEEFEVGDWTIRDAALTLCFAATPLVRQEVSDLTVSLNGRRFYSTRIPLTQGEVKQLTIPLPTEAVVQGKNSILIETYIRTNENDPCVEDVSKANWISVLSDSFVAVSYTVGSSVNSVRDLYKRLTSIDALENRQSAVFISRPDSVSLTIATYTLSGISSNATLYGENIELLYANQAVDMTGKRYAVYIAGYDDLLEPIHKLLSAEQQQAAQEGAVIALVKPTADCNVLVVTGRDEAAMINAGRLFGNKVFIEQTAASWRRVFPDESVLSYNNEEGVTRKLSDSGAYVKGPFRQEYGFFVRNPASRLLKAGSKVDLYFRYSENLDFNRSLVTVYLNDIPIGSKKLAKELANGDAVSFVLPDNLGIKGSFVVTAAFDLEIPDLYCTLRQEEMPWAFITPESTIDILTEDSPYLFFDYYPGPYIQGGRMNDIIAVLPADPQSADLQVLCKLMLTMGRFQTDNSGTMRVCTADDMGNLASGNVIAIGRYDRNPIAQQLNNQLFFQFTPEGTTIRSNEKLLIEPNYGTTLGTAQLLYSPYSAESFALLLVSGVTDAGMLQAAEYIGSMDELWKISGDAYIADNTEARSYRFKEDGTEAVPLGRRLSEIPNLTDFLFLGSAILILLLVGSLLLWRKHRRKKVTT